MNLSTVTVRNFRSFVTDQGHPTPSLELGDGLNLLVGPNNCGKSNLLRAIALALEDSGGSRFDAGQDIPHQLSWAYPHITLRYAFAFLADHAPRKHDGLRHRGLQLA